MKQPSSPLLCTPRDLGLPEKFTAFRPTQSQAIVDIMSNESPSVILNAPTGCHARGTRVVMYDGRMLPVEDVQVGDRLMGPDGTSRNVLRLNRGIDDMYRVTPVKGTPFVVNADHELSVYFTRQEKSKPSHRYGEHGRPRYGTITARNWMTAVKWQKHLMKLHHCRGIDRFDAPKQELPIDPYFLGLLLGDGSMHVGVSICTPDREIVETIEMEAARWGLCVRQQHKENNKAISYYFHTNIRGVVGCNPLLNTVRALKLDVVCTDKFVPKTYLTSDAATRLAVLAGLLDTDGYLASGVFEIICKGDQLKEDICFLAGSLGFMITVTTKTAPKVCDTVYWRMMISGDVHRIPTRVVRKQAGPRRQIKDALVTGFSIGPVGHDEYYGFHLSDDHLYLTSDFVVHHNCGKSLIPAAVSILEDKRVLVLTATKTLQDVYQQQLGMSDVRGANNYPCPALLPGGQFYQLNTSRDPDPRADHGPCLSGMKCSLRGGGCPRYDAIEVAKKSSMVVSNYDCWLAVGKREERERAGRAVKVHDEDSSFGKFDIIFMDELHSCMERVSSALRVELDTDRLHRLLDGVTVLRADDSIAKWCGWSRAISLQVADIWDEIKQDITSGMLSSSLMKELREIQALYRTVESMSQMDDEWVVDSQYGSGGRVLTFEPRWPGRYCERLLYRGIEKRVGMSATIRPAALRYVGIKEGTYEFHEYDSPFPVARRLVWQWPAVQLNYKTEKLPSTQRVWAEAIDTLRRARQDRKGVGFSVSYKRSKLYQQLTKLPSGLVTYEPSYIASKSGSMTLEEALQYHKAAEPPSYLDGPSHDTGHDFPMHEAEYGVLEKMPYPPMDTVLMRARVNDDPEFASVYAADKIVQATGRGSRSEFDSFESVLLDSTAGALMRQWEKFPRWHRKAWRFTREAPKPPRRLE